MIIRLISFFAALVPLYVSAQETDTIYRQQTLQQVIITSNSKKQLTIKNGNIIANIEGTPLSSVPDAVELLSKLPTIQISPDGNSISISGKGQPVIYIDNQKSSIDDLNSLSVNDIKSIEIINSPSARYEAEGRVVIQITRKINRKEGWKADITQTAAQRKHFLNRAAVNASFRRRKLELKGNIQYNYLETWEGNAFDFRITNKNVFSKYSVTAVTIRPQLIGSAGLFYQLNEQDYLSFNASARRQNERFPILTDSYLALPGKEETAVTTNLTHQPIRYYTCNLNYSKSIQSLKTKIFTGAQYTRYTQNRNSTIFNSFNNEPDILSQSRVQSALIEVLAARTDIETTLAKNGQLDWGVHFNQAKSNGSNIIINYQPDNTLNSTFTYNEKNIASYTTLSGKINKLAFSAGARMEVVNKYNTKLFPKAAATMPIDSSSTLSVKYAKTVTRPGYTNANQTSTYINPYFEWANNINLNPAYTNEITAAYQYKDYSVAASLYQTRGIVYAGFNYNEQNMVLRRSEVNYDTERGLYLTVTAPLKYKIWRSQNIMNIFYTDVHDTNATRIKTSPYIYFSSSNELQLPNKFVFTLSGWGVTCNQMGAIEMSGSFSVDSSLTKTFGKNLSCTLRFTDIFASIASGERFTVNDVAANGYYYDRLREVSLGVKYSFGRLKESVFKNRDIDENTNRIR